MLPRNFLLLLSTLMVVLDAAPDCLCFAGFNEIFISVQSKS